MSLVYIQFDTSIRGSIVVNAQDDGVVALTDKFGFALSNLLLYWYVPDKLWDGGENAPPDIHIKNYLFSIVASPAPFTVRVYPFFDKNFGEISPVSRFILTSPTSIGLEVLVAILIIAEHSLPVVCP